MRNYKFIAKAFYYDLIKNRKKAIRYYSSSDLDNGFVNYRHATNLFRCGLYKKADCFFEKAISSGVTYPDCFYKAAKVKEALGDKKGALNLISEAIKRKPNEISWIELYYNVGGVNEIPINLKKCPIKQLIRLAKNKIKEKKDFQARPALEIIKERSPNNALCNIMLSKLEQKNTHNVLSFDDYINKHKKDFVSECYLCGKYKEVIDALLNNDLKIGDDEKLLLALSYEKVNRYHDALNTIESISSKSIWSILAEIRINLKYDNESDAYRICHVNKEILFKELSKESWWDSLDNAVGCEENTFFEKVKVSSYAYEYLSFENKKIDNPLCFIVFSKILKPREKFILYESFLGNTMSCNPYAIFKYLFERKEYSKYKHIWVVNDEENIPPYYRNNKRILFVKRNSLSYPILLCSAKYLVNNVTFPNWFKPSKEQRYLNTWHGTPLKHLGIRNKWDKYAFGNISQNLLNSDILIHPNKYTENILIEDNQIKHLHTGLSKVTGYPRNDLTINANEEEKEAIRTILNIPKGKKVLLYAPTWRDYENLTSQISRITSVLSVLKKKDFFVIFKGHQFIEKSLRSEDLPNVPSWIDTNELLSVVDILVTDYSSIGIDFLVTKRPVYYFVDDFEKYIDNRGLYINVDKFPGIVCYNTDDLSKKLDRPYEHNYCDKYIEYVGCEDGGSTARVVSLLFNDKIEKKSFEKLKPTIVVYPGTLLQNGIFTACVNFVNYLCQDYNICLLISEKDLKRDCKVEFLNKFNDSVSILPVGNNLYCIPANKFAINVYRSKNVFDKDIQKKLMQCYEHKFDALFSRARVNAIVNFEGYNIYFANLLCAGTKNVERAIYCHSSMYDEYKSRFPWLYKVFLTYDHYNNVLSVGENANNKNRQDLSNFFGIDERKFHYVNNLLDGDIVRWKANQKVNLNKLDMEDGNFYFLTIGRMSQEKDHIKLIKAFFLVHKKKPNTKLLLIGSGYLMIYVIDLIRELCLINDVLLLGSMDNPYPILKKSDCFVLSSNYEGQPMVLLEALTLNKPIVSTSIPACEIMLRNKNAVLCENSIEGLVDGMLRAYDKPCPTNFDYKLYNESNYNIIKYYLGN